MAGSCVGDTRCMNDTQTPTITDMIDALIAAGRLIPYNDDEIVRMYRSTTATPETPATPPNESHVKCPGCGRSVNLHPGTGIIRYHNTPGTQQRCNRSNTDI